MSNITDGERDLIYWQYQKLGGFKTALWSAIEKADNQNMDLLAKGFPEQVEAYRRFTGEWGYWENVMERSGIL